MLRKLNTPAAGPSGLPTLDDDECIGKKRSSSSLIAPSKEVFDCFEKKAGGKVFDSFEAVDAAEKDLSPSPKKIKENVTVDALYLSDLHERIRIVTSENGALRNRIGSLPTS